MLPALVESFPSTESTIKFFAFHTQPFASPQLTVSTFAFLEP